MKVFIEIILQTLLAFFSILYITRILGRQQVAQLTVHEYINGITFGSIAATLATDINQRTWQHLIGLVLFGILTYLTSLLCLKSSKASKILQGEPVIVIEKGKILEENLKRYSYTVDDLNHLMRKKDVFDMRDVQYGILETTGELSIVKVSGKETVTLEDMNIAGEQQEMLLEVIVTGKIIYESLRRRNLTAKWLLAQLRAKGIKRIEDVFYAALDENNELYIDKMEDHLYP